MFQSLCFEKDLRGDVHREGRVLFPSRESADKLFESGFYVLCTIHSFDEQKQYNQSHIQIIEIDS